ncbi:MAG: hypothetical protein AUI08_01925 [Gemmatimonadetes bacterium 13_2_20CM_2_65_7]|nr:MAG: hypothetical protein AUI08_01925 [Gemmatimonadetes bacterium 13_2_20CM_2_65_7]
MSEVRPCHGATHQSDGDATRVLAWCRDRRADGSSATTRDGAEDGDDRQGIDYARERGITEITPAIMDSARSELGLEGM